MGPDGKTEQAEAVMAAVKKIERIHAQLLKDGIQPSSLVHLWESSLELRRLHHVIAHEIAQ